jgi:hypothetical protein
MTAKCRRLQVSASIWNIYKQHKYDKAGKSSALCYSAMTSPQGQSIDARQATFIQVAGDQHNLYAPNATIINDGERSI